MRCAEGAHTSHEHTKPYVTVRSEQLACKDCEPRNGRCVKHKTASARKPNNAGRQIARF